MNKIFVDTWAWKALADENDIRHKEAKTIYDQLKEQGYSWFTSNFVVDESYTLIRKKVDLETAVDFGEGLKLSIKTGVVKVIHITEEIEEKAWEIFSKYKDQNFSFTDCTSFVVMQEAEIKECFTDDEHFKIFGFFKRP